MLSQCGQHPGRDYFLLFCCLGNSGPCLAPLLAMTRSSTRLTTSTLPLARGLPSNMWTSIWTDHYSFTLSYQDAVDTIAAHAYPEAMVAQVTTHFSPSFEGTQANIEVDSKRSSNVPFLLPLKFTLPVELLAPLMPIPVPVAHSQPDGQRSMPQRTLTDLHSVRCDLVASAEAKVGRASIQTTWE